MCVYRQYIMSYINSDDNDNNIITMKMASQIIKILKCPRGTYSGI